jgi:hypothetical protein
MRIEPVSELSVYGDNDTVIDEPRDFRHEHEQRRSVTRMFVKARPGLEEIPPFAPTYRMNRDPLPPRFAVILVVVCLLVGTIIGGAIGATRSREDAVDAVASNTNPVTSIAAAQPAARTATPVTPTPDRAAPVPAPAAPVAAISAANPVATSVASTTDAPSPPVAASDDQAPPEDVPAKASPARHATRVHRHAAAAPPRTASDDANEDDDSPTVRAKQPAKVNKPKREKVDIGACADQVLGCIERIDSPVKSEPTPGRARSRTSRASTQ